MKAIEFITELKQSRQKNLAGLSTSGVILGFEVEFLVPKEGDNVGAYWAQKAEDKLGIIIEYGGNYEVAKHWRLTYEEGVKEEGKWGLEIISPPTELRQGIIDLKRVLEWIRTDDKLNTNGTTGLHLNLSFKDKTRMENIDPLKLMLFVGEKHLSEMFPRKLEIDKNEYPLRNFKGHVRQILPELARHLHNSMKWAWYDKDQEKMSLTTEYVTKWIEEAKKAITPDKDPYAGGGPGVDNPEFRWSKSFTVALVKLIRQGYIEFRVTGGDKYEERLDEILETLGRYIRVMEVASDPNAYRELYLKKAAKLIAYAQKYQKNPDDDTTQLEHEDRDEDLQTAFEEVFAKHNRVQEHQVRSFIRRLQDGDFEEAIYYLEDIYKNNKEHYPDFFNDPKVIRLLNTISKRYGLTRNEISNHYENFGKGEDGTGNDLDFSDHQEDWEYWIEKKQNYDYKPLIQWLRL